MVRRGNDLTAFDKEKSMDFGIGWAECNGLYNARFLISTNVHTYNISMIFSIALI